MLFEDEDIVPIRNDISVPLADRVRPVSIDDIVGQNHLIGENGPLRKFFNTGVFPSMIFWGPPGVGKTSIALLISKYGDFHFENLSAVSSGVKEVRQVITSAEVLRKKGKRTLLFIDEIHRFSKSQQDSLLMAVEKGIIILIGATTENPSFEVNSALLSRCQVYKLKSLSDNEIKELVESVIKKDQFLSKQNILIDDWDFLLTISAGDARTALNALDLAIKTSENDSENIIINRKLLENALQQKTAQYDKKGESHYDTISAFIKSLRGSAPSAALIWLAKMLEAGEDPKFIARRMVIFASEDIGNADSNALTVAVSVFQAVTLIGMPEAAINLAHGVTYLASAPKSNASYLGLMKAKELVNSGYPLTVPLHLRNAPTKLMKQEGYGLGYKYPHDFENHFIMENYFPENASKVNLYNPTEIGHEKEIKNRLETLWVDKKEKK
jgi:putative ATPase